MRRRSRQVRTRARPSRGAICPRLIIVCVVVDAMRCGNGRVRVDDCTSVGVPRHRSCERRRARLRAPRSCVRGRAARTWERTSRVLARPRAAPGARTPPQAWVARLAGGPAAHAPGAVPRIFIGVGEIFVPLNRVSMQAHTYLYTIDGASPAEILQCIATDSQWRLGARCCALAFLDRTAGFRLILRFFWRPEGAT